MPRTIRATRAQVRAAKLIVERAERGIGEASPAVRAIARARPADHHPQPIARARPVEHHSETVNLGKFGSDSTEIEEPSVRR